ncbi:MAG: IS110 family RNA-guided transposase [Planctomycetota bacterium]|jgi:transposase
MSIIAFDSHKRYTFARVENDNGEDPREFRIEHRRGNITAFLSHYQSGNAVAIETIGNWYWIVNEIEQAQMVPKLVHARKAKMMFGCINKTDKLDAKGLNILQRTGTLPTVWIAPAEVRDNRELPRTRMVFARERTKFKNRIHSVIDKYGLQDAFDDISDMFGTKGRRVLGSVLGLLPSHTRFTSELLIEQLDQTEQKIRAIEGQMKELFKENDNHELLKTMPGIGFILAVVIQEEIGDIGRFGSAERLASYSGVTPRVHASGGKVRYGRLRPDTNRYLKWAFSEAGNSVAVNRNRFPDRHVSRLYNRIRGRKGHAKAVGAVARHLAEATYWILTKGEVYRDRGLSKVSPTGA